MSFLFEQALRRKCDQNPDLALLQAQWEYDRRLVADALQTVGWTFPHYSRHDVSHSNTILVQLARILGETRVDKLSATDVWLLLEAAYQHDVGMVVTDEQKREWLGSPEFTAALERLRHGEDAELARAATLIAERPDLQKLPAAWPLDVSRALTLVLADYGRSQHARNAERIVRDPLSIGLLSPRTPLIPERLFRVLGRVCAHHGRSFDETMLLPEREAGLGTDEAHPRFVACMLRLGDLLDLDNGRFCPVMMKGFGALPSSSSAHFEKHAAIKHLEIGPTRVEVEAECESYEAYEVTEQWLTWLREELKSQMSRWAEIAPSRRFGALPSLGHIVANKKGALPLEAGRRPRFEVDREAILTLVKGGNIYGRPENCIRELLQNAVDATILRLWREKWSVLPKEKLDELEPRDMREALKQWPIRVSFAPHVIDGQPDKERWHVTIADQGIGIAFDELRFIQHVGGSSKNPRRQEDLVRMPEWVQPSGVFGIGLQSVFLLTNQAVLTTRHHETRDVLRITLLNGQGPGTDGLVIERLTRDEALRIEIGTTFEFDMVYDRAPQDFFARESEKWPRITSARRVTEGFARRSVCLLYVDGEHNPAVDLIPDGAFYYFDHARCLALTINTSLGTGQVSAYYRGVRTAETWHPHDLLVVDCDVYASNASSVLELNREKFTRDGRRFVQAAYTDAIVRAVTQYFAAFRNLRNGVNSNSLPIISLYAHLSAAFSQEIAGDEWQRIALGAEKGTMRLEEIANLPAVIFRRTTTQEATAVLFDQLNDTVQITVASNRDDYGWMMDFLRLHFPKCTFSGGHDWLDSAYHFYKNEDVDVLTEAGFRSVLEPNLFDDETRSRRTIPCAKRFSVLAYGREANVNACDSCVSWLWPRMVSPFVWDIVASRATLPNLSTLVEWTSQNTDGGPRNERDVAQAMWDFIVEADKLMIKEWNGKKGYTLEEAKLELSRWLK
jgi:hypothetical protein